MFHTLRGALRNSQLQPRNPQAKQRAEDRAEAEAARAQEMTALYVEATDALALEKAKASPGRGACDAVAAGWGGV